AEKMNVNRYTKRLDAYQHLVIMLYAQLGQFDSLREVELGFLCAASRMNHFRIDYMVGGARFLMRMHEGPQHSLNPCTKLSMSVIQPF
ncbi:MAG: DUF4372 domain-containing protein, partial [Paludibacteraceae bacterium]|nr:DUF4372 domain-containing protein [Paludibacteraceae bacterium]